MVSKMLRPVVLSGPSGCGKSTLLEKLFKDHPSSFGFSVSHTTRKPRKGEVNGKHYHFTTIAEMEKDIEDGCFIEYTKFSGNMYGTSKQAINDVLNDQRICLLDVDEAGVKSIKQTDLDALYVFIAPPSLEELKNRLMKRGTESEESLQRRMSTASSAIDFSKQAGSYDVIIVNEDLEVAYNQLKEFLIQFTS